MDSLTFKFSNDHDTTKKEIDVSKFYAALPLIIALAGCDGMSAAPTVVDYNGASVTIQVSQFATQEQALAEATPEAARICANSGKRGAEFVSVRASGDYVSDMLFICK